MLVKHYLIFLVRVENVLDCEPDSYTHLNKGCFYIKEILQRNTDFYYFPILLGFVLFAI